MKIEDIKVGERYYVQFKDKDGGRYLSSRTVESVHECDGGHEVLCGETFAYRAQLVHPVSVICKVKTPWYRFW